MSHDFDCPYCDAPFEVCHDDGHGYQEGVLHHDHCRECGKNFTFTTSISFYFEPQKADCLNGGEHIWKPSRSWPIGYSKMVCVTCDEERKPTDDEMAAILAAGKERT